MSTQGEELLVREVPCRIVSELSVKETELTKRDNAQHCDSGSHLPFSCDGTHSFPAVLSSSHRLNTAWLPPSCVPELLEGSLSEV